MDETHNLAKLHTFFSQYPIQTHETNELLLSPGRLPCEIYYVEHGQVWQYDISNQGNKVVVGIHIADSIFPAYWALETKISQYFYEVHGGASVRTAPLHEFLEFAFSNPDILLGQLKGTSSSLRDTQRRMAHAMGGNATNRVLYELLLECKRFGQKQKDGSYRLNMHEDILAELSGLSRETISRELKVYREAGLLDIDHQCITIKNITKLEQQLDDKL